MSKFSTDNYVRVTDPASFWFDQVGRVERSYVVRHSFRASVRFDAVLIVSFEEWALTLAEPTVTDVLDQMDAESAPTSKGMDEREIDGEYTRHSDPVQHPAHYGGDTTYEVIKVAEAWGLDKDAYLFNVLKYVARAGKKGPALEDLDKGAFYLDRRRESMRAAL